MTTVHHRRATVRGRRRFYAAGFAQAFFGAIDTGAGDALGETCCSP